MTHKGYGNESAVEIRDAQGGVGGIGAASTLYGVVVAVLLFLLLREWVLPLVALSGWTQLDAAAPVLLAVGGFLAADAVRMRGAVRWSLKLWTICAIIVHYYSSSSWNDFAAWKQFGQAIGRDALNIFDGTRTVSPPGQTFLLLAGWAVVTRILHAVSVALTTAVWLTGATVLYLLGMQAIFAVDTNDGVVRAMIVGLLLLLLQRRADWARECAAAVPSGRDPQHAAGWPSAGLRSARWLASSIVVLAAAAGAGWIGADMHAEGRPLLHLDYKAKEWVTGASLFSRHAAAGRTGYGRDDGRLGVPLVKDDAVAFVAETQLLGYWRGESKPYYTGKGWEVRPVPEWAAEGTMERNGQGTDAAGGKNGVNDGTYVQEVWVRNAALGRLLFASGDIAGIERMLSAEGVALPENVLLYDPLRAGYTLQPGASVSYYRVTVRRPPSETNVTPERAELAEAERRMYLQLPDSLPKRVKTLAKRIVDGADTELAKARAIESYLRTRYAYDLEHVTEPPAGKDFVDHFLFEQRRGYCDHFSTAMAVMLRVAGIPARWVKGFSRGEAVKADGPSAGWNVTVRNSDAHSWVEAFVEGRWIAFEPTPGFSGFDASPGQEGAPAQAGMNAPLTAAGGRTPASGAEFGRFQALGQRIGKLGYAVYRESDRMVREWERWSGAVMEDASRQWMRFLRGEGALSVPFAGPERRAFAVLLPALLMAAVSLTVWRGGRLLRAKLRGMAAHTGEGRKFRTMSGGTGLAELYFRKLARRYGPPRPGQTIREYVGELPRGNPAREAAIREFGSLLELLMFGGEPAGRSTRGRLEKLWNAIRRG